MSTAWYSKKWVTVLLHTAIWLLLFSLPFLLRPSMNNNNPPKQEQQTFIIIFRYLLNDAVYVCFFYFNAEFLIPKFIYTKKYKEYVLIVISSFLILLFITWLFIFQVLGQTGFSFNGHVLFNLFFFLFILAGSTAYSMIKDRINAEKITREKENENLKTELSLLRSQASPHFMFNVLNNMVALARKKSDLLEPSLFKFSSLMRYMLYEADEEKVSLSKEIEYLQSYIDLQQQRFGKNVKIVTDMQHVDESYEIEPMLLIPFVENAFKHGTGMIEDAEIDIHLSTEKDKLFFTVKNKYEPASVEIKDKTSGIGLTNVKRRLNLLYGKRHELFIEQKENLFTISLQLNLI